MKTMSRFAAFATAVTLALSTFANAAPKSEGAKKYFQVYGTVLEVDRKERTLLVEDRCSRQKYQIEVPEGVTFKIIFGASMLMAEPGLKDVNAHDRVQIRCKRSPDHL